MLLLFFVNVIFLSSAQKFDDLAGRDGFLAGSEGYPAHGFVVLKEFQARPGLHFDDNLSKVSVTELLGLGFYDLVVLGAEDGLQGRDTPWNAAGEGVYHNLGTLQDGVLRLIDQDLGTELAHLVHWVVWVAENMTHCDELGVQLLLIESN